MPKIVDVAEGHVQKQPLAVVAIVCVSVHHASHQCLAVCRVHIDPVLQGHADLAGAVHATISLGDLAVVAPLAEEVEESHVVASPRAAHVFLHDLRRVLLPGHGHHELAYGGCAEKLWLLLHRELPDHLRL